MAALAPCQLDSIMKPAGLLELATSSAAAGVAHLLVMLGLDSVKEVLGQLGGLDKGLRDGGGDVDVQRIALLDARTLPAQCDVCARLRCNVLHVAAICKANRFHSQELIKLQGMHRQKGYTSIIR